MNVITELLRGRGKRRAVDRIPVLEAELAAANWLVAKFREDLTHADALIASACQQRDSAEARDVVLAAELEALQVEREAIVDAYDELAARYRELEAELRNRNSVRTPAPADHGPAIVLRDPDETAEIHVSALWDAFGMPTVNAA